MAFRKHQKRTLIQRLKRFLIVILVFLIMSFTYSMGIATYENIKVNKIINDFKSRSVYEYEETIEYYPGVFQTRVYHKVSRETSYELNDTRSIFTDESRRLIGQKGDIFLSQQSPFPGVPIIHPWISYNFGGHAAIHNGNNRFIEAVGFPQPGETILDFIFHPGDEPHNFSATVSVTSSNYWLNPNFRSESSPSYKYYGNYYRPEFIGIRVKNVTQEQIDGAVAYADDKVDISLYNFTFALDLEYKFYCTDLISRAYQSVLIEPENQRNYARALNDDRFITSVNDMIMSEDVYLAFYVEIIDEVVHIYYLEDVN